ncbi:hypothetical protein D9619_001076 [Psilocybe cf. subviscida]|uniref:AB hydrolase-1 domain-containing protein n=1 Tax=Psilocybe cf. subviscida TaxID=2480587 RepID=A0A8H5BF53_9AGAR|nr:hypothetical protein D9619_001076 [Psilocybe cf. subviscida]
MIGNTFLDYLKIRAGIFACRAIAPLSTLYLSCFIFFPPCRNVWIASWAAVEAGFYFLVYLPRKSALQAPPITPPPHLDRDERRLIFTRCLRSAHILDEAHPYPYPTGWFFPRDEHPYREDCVDWLLWALFSSTRQELGEDGYAEIREEIDDYMEEIERILGEKLKPGHSSSEDVLKSMRITLDPVRMLHRPLIWYMIVCLVDTYTSVALLLLGFTHYTPRPAHYARCFPPRPILWLVSQKAPEGVVTPFWCRRHHSSSSAHSIVFLHGVGIGLYPYIPFVRTLISSATPGAGIVLPELLPICMHMTPRAVPPRAEMLVSLDIILESMRASAQQQQQPTAEHSPLLQGANHTAEAWNDVVLVSHSYGTFIAGWVLRECVHTENRHALADKIAHLVVVDPIPILLSHPAVAHNFLYREPEVVAPFKHQRSTPTVTAVASAASSSTDVGTHTTTTFQTEPEGLKALAHKSRYSSPAAHQLFYFASRDADIARTLGRAFFWAEGGVWREEIEHFITGAGNKGDRKLLDGETAATRVGARTRRRNMAVVIGGEDQIVPAEAIRRYLTRDETPSSIWTASATQLRQDEEQDLRESSSNSQSDAITERQLSRTQDTSAAERSLDSLSGGRLDVLFNPGLDHAVIFDDPRWTEALVDVVSKYANDV